MKKVLLSLTILSFIAACGGSDAPKTTTESTTDAAAVAPTTNDLSSNPVYQKGVELTGKFMCPSCHKIDEKLTGPGYREVAEKYAGADDATVAQLAKKIIDGGSGVWGEIPMTPHPNVTEQEAKDMVNYILLLKK